MRLAQIHSILKSEPLFCQPSYRETLLELLQQHATLSAEDYKHKRTGMDKSGQMLEIDEPEVRDGVYFLPVGGPIGQNLGEFEKGAGAVDIDDIAAEIEEADNDESVHTIVMDFDTPGGMVQGTPETGNKILAVDKPIYAWSRGSISSAGYWLASCCDGIFCTPTAQIGCIGVCCSFMDLSKMAEMAGIKVKVFGSGTFKGMGTPGTSLTAQQEVFMQNRVMQLAQTFYDHVRSQRGDIADEDMQGQTFSGVDAKAKGFVDEVFNSLDELETILRAK